VEYPVWGIADNGPAAGQVFEIDERQICVKLVCDDGTHRYHRYAFGASKKGWRIARFAFIDTLVS